MTKKYMTATSHAIIGTIIAAKIGNPALAIPIALASHFAADLIPHWDAGTNREKKTYKRLVVESAADVLVGLAISLFLLFFVFAGTSLIYAALIIFFAQLPDWLMGPYYFFGVKEFKWAYEIGKSTNRELDKPWGIINQIAILILLVAAAKVF